MKIKIKSWVNTINVTFPFVLTEAKQEAIDCYLKTSKDYQFIRDITPHGQLLSKRPRVLRFEYQSRFISENKFERLMLRMATSVKNNVKY